jgi:hypothetical protein
MEELGYGNIKVGWYQGNIVSVICKGKKYFHGGGKPDYLKDDYDRLGWQNSELIMFPIIGPVENFQMEVCGQKYPMDQHGIARHLDFSQENLLADSAVFLQN